MNLTAVGLIGLIAAKEKKAAVFQLLAFGEFALKGDMFAGIEDHEQILVRPWEVLGDPQGQPEGLSEWLCALARGSP